MIETLGSTRVKVLTFYSKSTKRFVRVNEEELRAGLAGLAGFRMQFIQFVMTEKGVRAETVISPDDASNKKILFENLEKELREIINKKKFQVDINTIKSDNSDFGFSISLNGQDEVEFQSYLHYLISDNALGTPRSEGSGTSSVLATDIEVDDNKSIYFDTGLKFRQLGSEENGPLPLKESIGNIMPGKRGDATPVTTTPAAPVSTNISKTKDNVNDTPILKSAASNFETLYIPRSIYELAYKNDEINKTRTGGAQTLDTIIKRGGYTIEELNKLLPNWKELLAPVSTDARADIERRRQERKNKSLNNITPQTKTDIKTGNERITSYATLYYPEDYKDSNDWNFVESLEAKTEQELIDKINAKYAAELDALGQPAPQVTTIDEFGFSNLGNIGNQGLAIMEADLNKNGIHTIYSKGATDAQLAKIENDIKLLQSKYNIRVVRGTSGRGPRIDIKLSPQIGIAYTLRNQQISVDHPEGETSVPIIDYQNATAESYEGTKIKVTATTTNTVTAEITYPDGESFTDTFDKKDFETKIIVLPSAPQVTTTQPTTQPAATTPKVIDIVEQPAENSNADALKDTETIMNDVLSDIFGIETQVEPIAETKTERKVTEEPTQGSLGFLDKYKVVPGSEQEKKLNEEYLNNPEYQKAAEEIQKRCNKI
jgi:hypothetical protein